MKRITINGVSIIVIKARELFVDDRYQRGLSMAHAKRIAANWDWNVAGIWKVGPHRKGVGWPAIDGHHRLEALKINHPTLEDNGKDIEIPAVLVNENSKVTSLENEARCFSLSNQSKPVTRNWLFKADHVAGDDDAKKVMSELQRVGLTITIGGRGRPSPNVVKNPVVFRDALKLLGEKKFHLMVGIVAGFKTPEGFVDSRALRSDFLNGLARFISTRSIATLGPICRNIAKVPLSNIYDIANKEISERKTCGWRRCDCYANAIEVQTRPQSLLS